MREEGGISLPSEEAAQRLIRKAASLAGETELVDFFRGRKTRKVRARGALYYVMHEQLGLSYPKIGKKVGKDHATVMNGRNRFEELLHSGDSDARMMLTLLIHAARDEETADLAVQVLKLDRSLRDAEKTTRDLRVENERLKFELEQARLEKARLISTVRDFARGLK